MTVTEWLTMLNGFVIFWPTKQRCEQLLQARAYRGQVNTVMEFDTATLLQHHEVKLSAINAGAVLYNPPRRGSHTFTSIENFPFDRYRRQGRREAVAEVAVDYAVP